MYFLPSICMDVMSKKSYFDLKKEVYDGASLYISMKDGFLTEFREFTRLKVITAEKSPDREPSGGRSPALLTGNRIISGLQQSGRRFWQRMTRAIPYSAWLLMGQAKYIF